LTDSGTERSRSRVSSAWANTVIAVSISYMVLGRVTGFYRLWVPGPYLDHGVGAGVEVDTKHALGKLLRRRVQVGPCVIQVKDGKQVYLVTVQGPMTGWVTIQM
jgi:hypothetical protein